MNNGVDVQNVQNQRKHLELGEVGVEELKVSELLKLADELQGLLRGLHCLCEKLEWIALANVTAEQQSKAQGIPRGRSIRGGQSIGDRSQRLGPSLHRGNQQHHPS